LLKIPRPAGHSPWNRNIVLMVAGNPDMTGQTVAANGGMHFN
jgi:hypothetical protein